MIRAFIERIENAEVPFFGWLAGFFGIVFVRFFIENLSNPTPSFPGAPDVLTMVHYGLFYLAVFLALALVIRIFVPDVARITKILLFGYCIIWIPPTIDLIMSRGSGLLMSYVFTAPAGIWSDFLTLGGSSHFGGLTIGIKAELVVAMLLVAAYVFVKTKSVVRAIVAAILSYAAIFVFVALPSIVALMAGMFAPAMLAIPAQTFLLGLFGASHIGADFVMPSVQYAYDHAYEATFNLGMGMILFMATIALAAGWFAAYRRNALKAVLDNARPTRMIHYFLMITAGTLTAIVLYRAAFTGFDAIPFIVLLLTFACAWCFAVSVNDISDIALDAISNRTRPLVTGSLTRGEMKAVAASFFAAALVGGYLSGYWAIFCVLLFMAVFYVLTVPPLRLKRVPFLANIIHSLAELAAALAGFYFLDPNHLLADFPKQGIVLIVVCFTLGLSFKDMKDIEGDRAEGVITIPVLFGKYGAEATGALMALGFLAVPAILGSWILFWPSLVAAAIGYFVVVMKPFREWRVFVLYFAYLAILAFVLL